MSNPSILVKSSGLKKPAAILKTAITKLTSRAETYKKEDYIADYQLQHNEKDGLTFTATRLPDGVLLLLRILPGEEVFIRRFDSYDLDMTGHYDDEQAEALDLLMDDFEYFMKLRDYHEEIFEKNGKPIFKFIIYKETGSKSGVSLVFAGRFRRFFGATTKRIATPPAI